MDILVEIFYKMFREKVNGNVIFVISTYKDHISAKLEYFLYSSLDIEINKYINMWLDNNIVKEIKNGETF